MTRDNDHPTPDRPIRRFDVFAEYTRLERLAKGDADAVAKGYGIWLAKVVASRRFGAKADGGDHDGGRPMAARSTVRSIGDEPQTGEVFDREVVERMGGRFYAEVFAPAIAAARSDGGTYEGIRDAIRKPWKPATARDGAVAGDRD